MKKQWKKFMLSVLLIVCVSILNCSSVFAANGITRGEWIHNLVKTFDMKIEDGLLPDDYYGDISDSKYYDDILIATNFGLIDLEAGEDFNPDKMVTREFAAHTLNYCLGYELEDATYTMKDKDDLTYADDAQVAINFGWLSLDNDKFMPNDTITSNESTKMLEYATTVLKDSQIDTAHKNTYTFAGNVKEIPESTSFEWTDDDHVVIYDTGLSINKGDYFAVYEYGIAYTYKALDVTTDDSSTVIEVEDVDYEESVDDVDAQGTVDVELGDFIPASDDITVENEYETNATSDENGAPTSKGTKKVKKITLTRNVGPGTVTCNITDISINYKLNKGKYLFCVDGKATASYTISGKASKSILLGSIPVDGLGKITVTLNLSANGSATVSFSSNFQCGVEYSKRDGVRKIMNFTTPTWHFSAKAELKAGYNVAYEISVPSIANGRIFADLGIKSTPDTEVFGDGKKPTCCIDLPAWFYTTVGYSVKICGTDIINESIPIYSQNNSPLYVCYHLEDGMRVSACTRGADATRVGRRGYYTLTDADGSYSGNAFVAPWANASKPIFEYQLNDDEQATITKYTGSVAYLTIPDELDGYPVIGIGNEVFKGNTSLRSVVIPDSITTIGDNSFNGCTNLETVILSKNKEFTTIAAGAFKNTTSLKKIEMSDSIVLIRNSAFSYSGLTQLHMSNKITQIESYAFYSCKNLSDLKISEALVKYENSCFGDCDALQSVEIPKNVAECPDEIYPNGTDRYGYKCPGGMFSECDNLKSVTFETGIKQIAVDLFKDCPGLEEITIPNTVTEIQSKAFYNCANLKQVNLPESLTKIGILSFAECGSLEKIDIPDSVTVIGCAAFSVCDKLSEVKLPSRLNEIGSWAFKDCNSLQQIDIPKGTSVVSSYYDGFTIAGIYGPFQGCTNLSNIILEDGMKKIPANLFKKCSGLENIDIPDSVEEIGNNAFLSCTSLKEINIPNSVTSMGNYVFSGCSSLQKVHLPDIKINVQEGMFENCSSLSEINLPDTLTAIQYKAFINCTSLAELVLPKNVTTIENDAFSGCTGLTKITIPESMRTIGKRAFSHCEALTDLEIAEGTTSIGEKAFEYCVLLEKVKLPDTLNTLGASAFTNSEKISDLNLGAGLTVIPNYCFYQIPALKKVILPQQVTTINDYAFANCTALKDITINQKVTSIKTSAFSYSDMVIHGVSGSYAETFAKENDYTFVPLDNPATAIQLSATKYSIARGKTKQLSATVTPLDSSDQLTWTSSDEDIVTVTDTGLIKGIKVGNASIIAMAGDVIETCDITVYEGVTSVDLNKTSNEMTVGDTFQLTATVYPKDATNQKISWSSSDEKVATVDKDGLVTAKSYGKAAITVTTADGGYTRSCNITVSPIAVTGITLNKKAITVGVAESFTLVPTITPENATDKSVTWTSSKPAVATVKDGVITGVSEGTAIVIAKTVDGAKTASCTVTVKGGATTIAVTGVTLDQTEATLETDSTVTLAAQILPENATNKKISWISDNEEVATVENGVVTAHKAGTATITVTTADGGYTAACIITVKDLTVEGITLDKQEAVVEAGNCIALRTSFTPDKILSANVTWSSDNEAIATVNSYGIVNAISEGTANITATTDNGLTAVCTVTVTLSTRGEDFVSVEGLEITGASSTEIQLDGALTLSVIVLPENATNPNVIWTSTNPSVASIDDTGKVTLNHAGQVTFIATSESTGISTEFTMTVLPIPAKTYTITYHLDGGVNSANNPDSYLDGDAFSFENPTKEGYIFDGWFTDAQYTNPISGITKDTTEDITLYAKWTEEITETTWKYSVTFSGNGATSGTMSDLTECESGVSYELPTCGYSRTGFLFNGWNTAKDGSGDSLADGADILNLTEEDNGTVTLYAQWKPISYTIHFDKNTAKSGSMRRVYPKYGRNYRLPACGFKKPGYTFAGWNTRKDGKGTTYKNQSNVKNLTTTNGKVVFLYAQWKKVSLSTAGKPTLGNYAAGRLTVTCKAVKGADGYLIQYSTNKNMKNAKTVSSKTLKKNIYKLKKGTTYYVRVRAYKVDSAGKKVCGKYSGVQAKKLTK